MSVNDTAHNDNSALNRQVYHRLKLALSLSLRRQLFIAVCDNLYLRNQIAGRLHSTLAYPIGQVLSQPSNTQENSTPAYPRLVTLRLNLNDPNPIIQINQWLANYPPPIVGASKDTPGKPFPVPAFQIVGVEHLTKQPVATQRLFLHHLRLSEQYFSVQESSRFLESNLLLWIPRPWLSAIKQSAPQFWRCRTGVFVFAGEPTPTTQNSGYPERFSSSKSLDLGNIEQSILDESVTPGELRTAVTEFKFKNNSDFPAETPGNGVHKIQEASPPIADLLKAAPQQQESPNRSSSDNPQSLSSLSYISSELTELVIATINTNIAQDTEDYLQPQQILLEIEELHEKQVPVEILAEAYHRLGTLYRLRIEQGDSTLENLMVAIIAYQEAISYDETSPQL
ncbi:MAG: tetratricopeptide repeat protein, partial [Nostoc sp. C3-bin3]|nr:tetratricopeptide repeat protein [Nostoc sp. C3-bin3]